MSYRIAGHESFSCRYTWLPKAVRVLTEEPSIFNKEQDAMVGLGVGKNMVRSIRFWSQASGVISNGKGGAHSITDFGRELLGDDGLDEYLEDVRTLWLIHWKLSTVSDPPLLAWDYLQNRWQEPEMVPTSVLEALLKEANKHDDKSSHATIEQHFDTFIHTYVPTRGRKGDVLEDNLDCPLVELDFIQKIGERETNASGGRREPIYTFRRNEKPEITPELFIYCLNEFWEKQRHSDELTIYFREVAHGHGSPGQIFKLPEDDVRRRLEEIEDQSEGMFSYTASANLEQVHRNKKAKSVNLLAKIFQREGTK
jgi:hypothetical protein